MLQHFLIADHCVTIEAEDSNIFSLLPSFVPFISKEAKGAPMLSIIIQGDAEVEQSGEYEEIGQFDCGGANHGVYRNASGNYKFFIYSIDGKLCSVLDTAANFHKCTVALCQENVADRAFGLGNAIMIAFAFATMPFGTLMMHASVILHKGRAFLFQGKSGTGKSTHSRLWLENIPDCELLNDDNPVVRIFPDNTVIAYGTPWSGKTPCYRQLHVPVGSFLRLEQAPQNVITRHTPLQAFASILSSCSTMIWDKALYRQVCTTSSAIAQNVGSWQLRCLPNAEAAQLSHSTIAQ